MPKTPVRLSACLCLLLIACSGGNNNETTRNLGGRDAGADSRDEPDATDTPDAADESDTAVDEPLADAGETVDGGQEPLDATREDSALDAAPEASAIDAGPADGGASAQDSAPGDAGSVIYASFGGRLVRIDPDTAKLTEVGTLRNVADAGQPFVDVVMTWTGMGDTAWLVTSDYQTPTLAKANLCTAEVEVGPRLVRPNSPNLVVEGLAVHPNGNLYVTSGNPGDPMNSPISSNLGTLDAGTGAITDRGVNVTGVQGDMDMLFVRGDTLYGVDVVTTNARLGLFTFNLETGKDTQVVVPTYGSTNQVPLRVAYDKGRSKAFTWRPSDRNLLTFDLATGAVTPIGETHPANSSLGAVPRAFFVAPAPSCPSPDI